MSECMRSKEYRETRIERERGREEREYMYMYKQMQRVKGRQRE